MREILTYNEAKERGLHCSQDGDGVYGYKNKNGYYSLIIEGVDVLDNLDRRAVYGFYRPTNKSYIYEGVDGYWHIFIKNINNEYIDVLKGRKARDVFYYNPQYCPHNVCYYRIKEYSYGYITFNYSKLLKTI